jgi:FkbM family methyltransferase
MVDPYQKYLDNIENHDDLKKVCVAIGPERKSTNYYKIKNDVLEHSELDYRGMCSIDPKTPLLFDEYKGLIDTFTVPVITFDDLIESTQFGTEIDFLKIDTEGMDLDIIQSIDLEKYNIKVILCEVRTWWEDHLKDYLENNGYLVQILYDDLFAVKLNLFDN